MEMIRCPRCAREIPDFSRFCRRCGCAIVWRGQFGAPAIPAVPPVALQPSRPTTLGSSRQVKAVKSPAARVKPSVRSGSGGAGIFAIFAAAGLVCFINYHAVMRPVSAPTRVRYQQVPPMPEMTTEREDIAPYLVPTPVPAPAYPQAPPQRNASSSWSRRYVPQPPPTVPLPHTPGAPRAPDGIIVTPPVSPWEADHFRSSPRDERDRDR